jgi:hypothetical protein
MNEIGYPFWFFSGLVAARVAELHHSRRKQRYSRLAMAEHFGGVAASRG